MDKHEKSTGMDSLFKIFFYMAILAFFAVLVTYIWHFAPGSNGLSHEPADWAEFGEYIGGTLGAFFGFLAFIGVLINIVLQRRALDDVAQRLTRCADAAFRPNSKPGDRIHFAVRGFKRDISYASVFDAHDNRPVLHPV
jgi:hypothetical protein